MRSANDTIAKLGEAASIYGKVYAQAVGEGDDARSLAAAQQFLVRVAEVIPQDDDGHLLMTNILFALQEVAAGKFDNHPILRGRYSVGGVGQVSALQEHINGLGAAVMIFLTTRGVSDHKAAKLVGRIVGAGTTAPKNWISDPKRKLLKAMARPSLDRIDADYAAEQATDPVSFAEKWLQENVNLILTLSPR